MSFIVFLVFGLIAGALAKLIMPGKQGGGIIVTLILGVVGAMLGGWIAGGIFDLDVYTSFFEPLAWVFAIGGAVLVLVIYGLLTRNSRGKTRA